MLEALEAQGLSLSQVEKLLPIVDDLGLLPLAVKNKDLVLSLAPLIVDTAFLGLPLAAGVVGTSPSTYSTIAFGCFALAGYEGVAQGNAFLAILLAVLGTPAADLHPLHAYIHVSLQQVMCALSAADLEICHSFTLVVC